jgi:DNA-directed RNA polymerase specialized sigma24 family protein
LKKHIIKNFKGKFINIKGANTITSSLVVALFKSGLRTDEIAQRMGCTEAAVANSLHRWRELRRLEAA